MSDKLSVLKDYFGHDSFRDGQEQIVDALLDGRDALCIMPTGAGKSMCYQIPALLFDGVTIVVSPLISLMKDQVGSLVQSGVPAAYINSSLSYPQFLRVLSNVEHGKYKIIYVAPERLLTDGFLDTCKKIKISMVAVDEAHCVSQWGQDFRPSYLKIISFVESLANRPIVGAFTATATNDVKEDIKKILRLENPFEITTGFDRPNLFFGVIKSSSKDEKLIDLIRERGDRSGIVYCATRKNVESVCELLCDNGFSAARYHAGLDEYERRKNQEDFVFDRKNIMVATNAFGMGIDKSNVTYVIHYNMPKNIESYYQEAGRAGRDGGEADCILLYSPKDVRLNRFMIENSEGNDELTIEEMILFLHYLSNRIDEVFDHPILKPFKKISVSKIFEIIDTKKRIDENKIVKATKKAHVGKLKSFLIDAVKIINPIHWFKKLVVNSTISFATRKISLIIIDIVADESNKTYSKKIFDKEKSIREMEIEQILEELEKEEQDA